MSGSRSCVSRSELMGHTIINKPVPGCQRGPPGWSLVFPRSKPGHQPLVSTRHPTPSDPPTPPPPTVFISNQLRLPRLHKGFYQQPSLRCSGDESPCCSGHDFEEIPKNKKSSPPDVSNIISICGLTGAFCPVACHWQVDMSSGYSIFYQSGRIIYP